MWSCWLSVDLMYTAQRLTQTTLTGWAAGLSLWKHTFQATPSASTHKTMVPLFALRAVGKDLRTVFLSRFRPSSSIMGKYITSLLQNPPPALLNLFIIVQAALKKSQRYLNKLHKWLNLFFRPRSKIITGHLQPRLTLECSKPEIHQQLGMCYWCLLTTGDSF